MKCNFCESQIFEKDRVCGRCGAPIGEWVTTRNFSNSEGEYLKQSYYSNRGVCSGSVSVISTFSHAWGAGCTGSLALKENDGINHHQLWGL